jgi:hypothetical protein
VDGFPRDEQQLAFRYRLDVSGPWPAVRDADLAQ